MLLINQGRFLENQHVFGVKGDIVFQKNAFAIQEVDVVAVYNPYLGKYIILKNQINSKNYLSNSSGLNIAQI